MLKVMNSNYETSNNLQKASNQQSTYNLYNGKPLSRQTTTRLLSNNNNNRAINSFSNEYENANYNVNYKPSPRPTNHKSILINKSNNSNNNENFNRHSNSHVKKSLSFNNERLDNNPNIDNDNNSDETVNETRISKEKLASQSTLNSSKVNRNYLLQMNKKYKQKISANISGTKFEIVKQALESIGCRIMPDDNFDCNLIWDDTRVSVEGISELKAFQRYNHFPAMSEISKKDALARNMLKIYKLMPQDFDFVPKTWIMPNDFSSLQMHAFDMKKMNQKRTYIMKPSNGAMGHGIKLYKNVDKIQPTDNYIVQEYIPNPYLLDGFKFDLRIYALVTSCDPLRAFIYNNGLVRLGTEEYQEPSESNIDHLFMHLTNYSVNKKNKQFYDEGDTNGETGTKRSLKYLFEHLRRNNKDTSKLWKNIQDIILKTLLVAEPYLFHTYKMCRPGQIPGTESVCFEILGFDILIDEKMKPWVIEVNRCPSFGTNQQIDFDIKSRLLINSFELLHLRASDRQRSQAMEKHEAKRRLYNLSSFTHKMDTNGLNAFESSIPKSLLQTLSTNSSNSAAQLSKRFKTKERRKVELIDQIKLFRREQRRQEYENRNLGNFSRLFPIDDKYDMEYYLNILSTTFNLFYPIGKQFQWKKTYERIKEDKLLNELAECDEDLYDQSNYEQHKKLNEYLKDDYMSTDSEEDTNKESDDQEDESYQYSSNRYKYNEKEYSSNNQRYYLDEENDNNNNQNNSISISKKSLMEHEAIKSNRLNTLISAVQNSAHYKSSKSTQNLKSLQSSVDSNNNSNNLNKSTSSLLNQIKLHEAKQNEVPKPSASSSTTNNNMNENINNSNNIINETENNNNNNNNVHSLNIAVLKLLDQLEIKFPGKSSQQTKTILNKLYSRLEFYKPKIANYWMVKLDDAKRAKILNIVKSNLMVILQKVFQIDQVENLRLFKIFTKLINRMLWMHGQGLWNCFVSKNNSSWESIFNKSTFTITDSELKCCYRVIELCKDSVLIVYQYAFEQKPNNLSANSSSNNNITNSIESSSITPLSSNTPTDLLLTRGSAHRNRNPSVSTNLNSLSKAKFIK